MTAPPHNSRIDRRTSLMHRDNEGSIVSRKEFLPDFDAGERVEKVRTPENESVIIIQCHEADVINEKCDEMLH